MVDRDFLKEEIAIVKCHISNFCQNLHLPNKYDEACDARQIGQRMREHRWN